MSFAIPISIRTPCSETSYTRTQSGPSPSTMSPLFMAAGTSSDISPSEVTTTFPSRRNGTSKRSDGFPIMSKPGLTGGSHTTVRPTSIRPTGPTCDGCHSVNYDTEHKTVTEWNVGCEKCHGPGSEHAAHPTRTNIVNPESLDSVRGNDVCIQCHSQGRPLSNPIQGRYYDWPVGFIAGERLADYWVLEELKPGTTDFYQYADLTAHKNRMQGNDFVQSNMYHRQLRCFDCHQVHSNKNESNLVQRGNALCLGCHNRNNPAGLKGTVEDHTHHAANSPGSHCVACHMPHIEQTIKDNFVAAHTFRFISPVQTEQSGIPNPCTSCHKDKTNIWAIDELKKWTNVSPWRVGN